MTRLIMRSQTLLWVLCLAMITAAPLRGGENADIEYHEDVIYGVGDGQPAPARGKTADRAPVVVQELLPILLTGTRRKPADQREASVSMSRSQAIGAQVERRIPPRSGPAD